jgi:uncharacterized membrane protein YdjX (TVP38/TMEM64 family)
MPASLSETSRRSAILRGLPLLAMVVAITAFWMSGLGRLISLQSVAEHHDTLVGYVDQHKLLSALAFLGIYIVSVAVSFPGAAVLTVVGGMLFGTGLGGILAVIAATAGATVIYFVARSSLGDGLAKRAGPFVARFAAGFERDALLYLLSLRLAPIFPFWLVNLAPALVGIKLRDHLAATFLGVIPGTFAFAALGRGLDTMVTDRQAIGGCLSGGEDCSLALSLYSMLTPQMITALACLAALALLPIAVKAVRARL